ncbi:mitochondrial 39-S ribosomal protein L47 (MRP-L47)-domain-containing protein [Exophiala viscosa]|uniref:Large ribosomal subunit protein uL29m n=1 Tax=Exophiala viscosa TaxID=2486360 RepID=A0AAN6E5Z4_9EURO|nr:mitochondrial 39-S ribosomal protein L47 (MRP-L47)-domain-containing protein [Exophiala viscosa]KAI1627868.1 mitochondrial 39-S ribosomal protein L47 (MRP-L47)-domain-containing protein [Exophiala viscosa]
MASSVLSFVPCRQATVPVFLAPAFARPTTVAATISFSRSYASKPKKEENRPQSLAQRPRKDANKQRGVSAIRRTGPRVTQGLWQYPLPVPVARDHRGTSPEYQGSEDHGLWGFFSKDKRPILPPEEESSHGRAWTYQELSIKSFDDLHRLYWVCVKEQNRVMTREKERLRVRAGYGGQEHEDRLTVVQGTMKKIREVLADRHLSRDQAYRLISQKYLRDIFPSPAASEEEHLEPVDPAAPVDNDRLQEIQISRS